MSPKRKIEGLPPNFESVSQTDLPSGRKGKHHAMLLRVLDDLETLVDGRAIKIPLDDFPGSVADLRSAINRATAKRNVEVATSSDEHFLYVWKPTANARNVS
jgi:hypothetical protein